MQKPFVLAIVGPTASGKTTLARKIRAVLKEQAILISHDSYYRDQSHKSLEERKKTNYDDPKALETELLVKHLKKLLKGEAVEIPVYDFALHTRKKETVRVDPKPVIILEGAFLFWERSLRELFDLKIFIDVEADIRLARRIKRDIEERGRNLEFVLYQWFTFVKPGEEKFIYPTKKYADLIIPEGGENKKAIEVIVEYLKKF